MSDTLLLADLLPHIEDGDGVGWPEEMSWLWTNQSQYMWRLYHDIKKNGVKKSIDIGPDFRVWDGHHRVAIAKYIGLTIIPVNWIPFEGDSNAAKRIDLLRKSIDSRCR